MLMDLARGTDWEHLSEYLSPSFFDVVPFLGITRQVGSLVRNGASHVDFDRTRAAHWKQHRSIPGLVAPPDRAGASAFAEQNPTPDALVEMFFGEIHDFPESILDLRARSFRESSWTPASVWTHWDAGFIRSVRDLYKGFYADDPETFDAALANLHLTHAKELFIRHFGGNNQRAVVFRLSHFKETFHEIFVNCKRHGAKLHPNFLPLGVILGTLYENLESRNAGPVDVRAAYERAI